MHDRNLEWDIKDGRRLKIKEMSSHLLSNTLKYIDIKYDAYISVFGKEKVELYKKTIKIEIRYRKIKNIELENNNELF
jgi:hypothetical protein